MNDLQKSIDAAAVAIGLKKGAPIEQILAVLKAASDLAKAQKGEGDAAPEEKPEEPKADEPKPEDKPAEASVEPPALTAVPALAKDAPEAKNLSTEVPAAPVAIPTPAPEVALDANGATSLAESPEAQAAAAKQIFDKLAAASGLDAAALLAAVSDNAEAIAALLGKQPESGQPSDKPAEGAPAVGAALTAELEATKAVLSKYKADADKANATLAAHEAKTKNEEAERVVDAVIKAGKVLDTARPHLVTLARDNRPAFDALMASTPQKVPTGEHAPAVPPTASNVVELSASQRLMFNTQLGAGAPREHAMKRALELKS